MLAVFLIWNSTSPAYAETDPRMTFFLDCNTIQKQVNVGFISNPDDPSNGPEIIAFKYELLLTPSGSTTVNDLAGATAKVNPALSNVVIAENKSEVVGSTVKITVAGGFTGGNGLPRTDFLFDIEGTNQKPYEILVDNGELYPKNSTTNAYIKTGEGFTVNPASCSTPTPPPAPVGANPVTITDFAFTPSNITVPVGATVTWTNQADTAHTVTSTDSTGTLASGSLAKGDVYSKTFTTAGTFPYQCNFHTNMTGSVTVTASGTPPSTPPPSGSGTTTISITSDKESARTGETFVLTAIITNRNNQSVDWAQVGGGRIDPPIIDNVDNVDGTTTSVFTAKMPSGTTADLVFKLNVGDAEARITVAAEDLATANAAQEFPTTEEKTLAELLEERRAALSGTTPTSAAAGNVHAAAGTLTQSGPETTGLLLIGSLALLLGWKRFRRSEV